MRMPRDLAALLREYFMHLEDCAPDLQIRPLLQTVSHGLQHEVRSEPRGCGSAQLRVALRLPLHPPPPTPLRLALRLALRLPLPCPLPTLGARPP